MTKRLYLSNQNKVIAGVGGGLGEYFDLDPVLIRVAFVVLAFLHGFGLIAYIVAWIAMPKAPAPVDGEVAQPPARTPSRFRGYLPGIALILIGLVFLAERLLWWFEWEYLWPVILILAGVVLVWSATTRRRDDSGGIHESL